MKYITNRISPQIEARVSVQSNTVVLAMLMIMVVFLSLTIFSHESLRLDEAQSLWQASHAVPGILKVIGEDVHVPFYHIVLHYWQLILGNDIVIARALSLLFFVLSIPAIYHLGRLAFNEKVGLFAALLLSVSPFMHWYGNEIRMYSLFTFLVIVNYYFYLAIFRGEWGRFSPWIGYTISALLGIFTHYFFFFALVTQVLFYLVQRKDFPVKTFRRFLASWGILALAFVPWGLYVISLGTVANTKPLLTPPTSVNVFSAFSQFLLGFQSDAINAIVLSTWPLLVLLAFLLLQRNKKIVSETIFFFASLVVPVALALIVSYFFKPLFLSRYLILTLPSLYILLGWLFSIYPRFIATALRTALVSLMVISLSVQAMSPETFVKENYRDASRYLSSVATAKDAVVLSAPFTIYPVEYYYSGEASLMTLPLWDRTIIGPIPAFSQQVLVRDAERIIGDHERLWLLLSYDQGYEDTVRAYFDTRFHRFESKEFSSNIKLYGYTLKYDAEPFDRVLARIESKYASIASATESSAPNRVASNSAPKTNAPKAAPKKPEVKKPSYESITATPLPTIPIDENTPLSNESDAKPVDDEVPKESTPLPRTTTSPSSGAEDESQPQIAPRGEQELRGGARVDVVDTIVDELLKQLPSVSDSLESVRGSFY